MRAAPSVVANLERSACGDAGAIAVTDNRGHTSYGALWRQALAIAAFLRREGLQRSDRVAIVMDNSAAAAAVYYGVLAAGGIAVTLSTVARAREYVAWLSHCSASRIIADSGHAEVMSALQTLSDPPRMLDAGRGRDLNRLLDGPSPIAPPLLPDRDDQPAMLLYTSGTTGEPKGVLLSHGNLAANTASIVQYLGLAASDSVVTVLPFHYAYGCSLLNTHVQAGGRLILEPNLVFPHRVVETLAAERATGFAGVPSTFALLLSRVTTADYDLTALRYLTQAGGPMPLALTARVRRAFPLARLFLMYGQTEATARLTYLPPQHLDDKPASVGVAVPGVEIAVRRADGGPAARGEEGEVWARGPNVMLGYWRDPAATAAAIRGGWLNTGDMGRLDGDGFLYLAGRRSDMIKTGAHRVHPRDVEDVILELEGVAEAAVVGVDDEILGRAIHACVVPAPGAVIDAMRVRGHCRERLAPHKVPKSIDIVDALPKTASGKVRTHALQPGPRTP